MDGLRRIFIKFNNFIVTLRQVKASPDEILILVPHCMQNSQCQARIVDDIRNCKGCGRCPTAGLFDIAKKFKVRLVVAGGGALARQKVKELKVKAIVAVACERELTGGILSSLPRAVLGVINERPNGPCRETRVDAGKVEAALNFFIWS